MLRIAIGCFGFKSRMSNEQLHTLRLNAFSAGILSHMTLLMNSTAPRARNSGRILWAWRSSPCEYPLEQWFPNLLEYHQPLLVFDDFHLMTSQLKATFNRRPATFQHTDESFYLSRRWIHPPFMLSKAIHCVVQGVFYFSSLYGLVSVPLFVFLRLFYHASFKTNVLLSLALIFKSVPLKVYGMFEMVLIFTRCFFSVMVFFAT